MRRTWKPDGVDRGRRRGTRGRTLLSLYLVLTLAQIAACASPKSTSDDGGVESVVISAAAPRTRTGTWSANYYTWPYAIDGTVALVVPLKLTFLRVGGYSNDANIPNTFGNDQLDTMVAYARAIGAEPILQVPLLADTAGQQPTAATAAEMVTYANVTKGYGIKYFSIGNEPDLYPKQGLPSAPAQPARPGYSPADYCADAASFVAQMKSVDPTIQIVGPDLSQPRGDWLTPILQGCGDLFDIVAVHRYPFSSSQDTLANAASDATNFRAAVASTRAIMQANGQGDKPLAITETNIAYDATTTMLEASPGTVASGLWLADILGASLDLGLWTMAVYDIIDHAPWSLGLIDTSPPNQTPLPEYYAYALFADHYGQTLVDVTKVPSGISVYASRNQASNATAVIAVNWNTMPAPLAFEVTGLSATPAPAIYLMPALSMMAVEIPDIGPASAWIYGEAQQGLGTGPQPLAPGTSATSPSTIGDAGTADGPSAEATVDTGGGEVGCNSSMPSADGELVVSDDYVTVGPLHGYAAAWTWVGSDSKAAPCATPICTAPGSLQIGVEAQIGAAPMTTESVSCSPAFQASALCTAGTTAADPTYDSVAALGFNLNQDIAIDAGSTSNPIHGISIPNSITVTVQKSGSFAGNSVLRLELTDSDGQFYCAYEGHWTSGTPIPITQFNSKCWDNTGTFASPSLLFQRVDVLVPSNQYVDQPFSYCLTNVSVE